MEGNADVLASGSERDPWRPSRRVVVGVLLTALLLGATGLGLHTWKQNRAERELYLQAVRDINLNLDLGPSASHGSWQLGVLNQSFLEVHVRRAALDFPDVELPTPSRNLKPFHRLPLAMPDAGACVPGLYQRGPQSVLVQATTPDGLDVTRQMTLSQEAQGALWISLRQRCRFLQPAEALFGSLRSARLSGGTLTLTYLMRNDGSEPLVLDRVASTPGVDVLSDALPMTVPPSAQGGEFDKRTLVVRLRVSSCKLLSTAVRSAFGGEGLDGLGTLKLDLHHQHAREQGYLGFNVFSGADAESGIDHGLRLFRTCTQVAQFLDQHAWNH